MSINYIHILLIFFKLWAVVVGNLFQMNLLLNREQSSSSRGPFQSQPFCDIQTILVQIFLFFPFLNSLKFNLKTRTSVQRILGKITIQVVSFKFGISLLSFFAQGQKHFYVSYTTVDLNLYCRMDQLSDMVRE